MMHIDIKVLVLVMLHQVLLHALLLDYYHRTFDDMWYCTSIDECTVVLMSDNMLCGGTVGTSFKLFIDDPPKCQGRAGMYRTVLFEEDDKMSGSGRYVPYISERMRKMTFG